MSEDLKLLTVPELLSEDKYIIPMYQRNYAWDEGEITQLIQDVIDYLPKKNGESHTYYIGTYYIGTLVVFERRDGKFEIIDGQQRLTTLNLLIAYLKNEYPDKIDEIKLDWLKEPNLHFESCDGKFEIIDGQQRLTMLNLLIAYLKNEYPDKTDKIKFDWPKELNLHFESRPNSKSTLTKIFNNQIGSLNSHKPEESNSAILNGYRLIQRIFPQKIDENQIDLLMFAYFLFHKVKIIRVKVPKDTDLNHYFEIMNNRGEQLEKHEVLKSRMMEALKNDKESQYCLHLVWEACANMEKYVQMGFPPTQRKAIFKDEDDWSGLAVKDFKELCEKVSPPYSETEQTLDEIIGQSRGDFKPSQNDESPERFNTIINFPNFLLHVLRVQTKQDVPLDDKRLISTFESFVLKGDGVAEKVKKFTFNLLRCKFLYDQYIIKREFIGGTDGWSLKRLSKDQQEKPYYRNTFGDDNESDNRRILMLLSAFHVSTPTLVYKHWLTAALHYLFSQNEKICASAYLSHLESVAKAFVFDRFLVKNGGLDYYTMIFGNEGACQTTREAVSENNMAEMLSFGKIKNNLVFNFLDYLLWVENQKDDRIKNFEFTFRSSVEHYYPQHPLPGHNPLSLKIVNSFGNLCLISHSKNSRLSNFMPEAKKEYYRNNTIDSVKQYLMMDDQRWPHWNEDSIKTHFKEMKSVLLSTLEPVEGLE